MYIYKFAMYHFCCCSVNSVLNILIILVSKSKDNVVLLFLTNSLKLIDLGTII